MGLENQTPLAQVVQDSKSGRNHQPTSGVGCKPMPQDNKSWIIWQMKEPNPNQAFHQSCNLITLRQYNKIK